MNRAIDLIKDRELQRQLLIVICLLPFLIVLGLVIESKIAFYPYLKRIGFDDYEIAGLYLLLAPFVFTLPPTSRKVLSIVRKIYWLAFFAIATPILVVLVLMIFTKQI